MASTPTSLAVQRSKTYHDVGRVGKIKRLGAPVEDEDSKRGEADALVVLHTIKLRVLDTVRDTLSEELAAKKRLLLSLDDIWKHEFLDLRTLLHSEVLQKRAKIHTLDTVRQRLDNLIGDGDEDMTGAALWVLDQFYGTSIPSLSRPGSSLGAASFSSYRSSLLSHKPLLRDFSSLAVVSSEFDDEIEDLPDSISRETSRISDEPSFMLERKKSLRILDATPDSLKAFSRFRRVMEPIRDMPEEEVKTELPETPTPDASVKKFLEDFGTWNFNPFALKDFGTVHSGDYMLFCGMRALEMFGLLEGDLFSVPLMANFLKAVEANYKHVPYHNVWHAIDVVSSMAYMLRTEFMSKHVSKLDCLSSLIAAICHDLGHDGYNNDFHVKTRSELAVTYNDSSVLENHHVALAFRLMREDRNNWFDTLKWEHQTYVRQKMIALTLATDMNKHFEKRSKLKQFVTSVSEEMHCLPLADVLPPVGTKLDVIVSKDGGAEDVGDSSKSLASYLLATPLRRTVAVAEEEKGTGVGPITEVAIAPETVDGKSRVTRMGDCTDEKTFFLKLVLHLCDISNPTKDMGECYGEFAKRVVEEFFNQGDRERELGLAVTPHLDRTKTTLENSQIGFMKFVVKVFFSEVAEVISEVKPMLDALETNLAFWEAKKQQSEV